MMCYARTALVCAPFLGIAPTTAQESLSEGEAAAIVVTGDRDVERQARDFVAALTPRSRFEGQVARFESEVCPAVVGLWRPAESCDRTTPPLGGQDEGDTPWKSRLLAERHFDAGR